MLFKYWSLKSYTYDDKEASQGNSSADGSWDHGYDQGASMTLTRGPVNFDLMFRNGIGITYKVNAKVLYQSSQTKRHWTRPFVANDKVTRYLSEMGIASGLGMLFSETYDVNNETGMISNVNSQFNVGFYGLGATIQGKDGGLDTFSIGIDSGVGLGTLLSGSLGFKSGYSIDFK